MLIKREAASTSFTLFVVLNNTTFSSFSLPIFGSRVYIVIIFQIVIPLKTLLVDRCSFRKVVINLMQVIYLVVFSGNAGI